MKKILSVVLVLCMLMSLCIGAQAAIGGGKPVATAVGDSELSSMLGASADTVAASYPNLTRTENALYTSDYSLTFLLEGSNVVCVSVQTADYSIYGLKAGMTLDDANTVATQQNLDFTMDNGATSVAILPGDAAIGVDYTNGTLSSVFLAAGDTAKVMIKSLGMEIVQQEEPAAATPAQPEQPAVTEAPAEPAVVEAPAVPASDKMELTGYLGLSYDTLESAIPGLSYGKNDSSAYTENFEVWCSIENGYVPCISIESSDYSLYGLYPTMTKEEAAGTLSALGYTYDEEEDGGFFVPSRITGLSYIDVNVENGKVSDIMCGAVEIRESATIGSADAPTSVVVSSSDKMELTGYLALPYDTLEGAIPGLSYGKNETSSYTKNFEVWCSIENGYVRCISIESSDYSLYGLYPTMTKEEAASTLSALGYAYRDDDDGGYFVYSSDTGFSYIDVNIENGKVSDIMCGGVDIPETPAVSASAPAVEPVVASGKLELAGYLGLTYAELEACVPDLSYGKNDTTAYTQNFDVWCSIDDGVTVDCISVESSDYSMFGLYPSMSVSDAMAAFDALGYAYEDDGKKLSVGWFETNLCWINAEYENGAVTEIMCGGVGLFSSLGIASDTPAVAPHGTVSGMAYGSTGASSSSGSNNTVSGTAFGASSGAQTAGNATELKSYLSGAYASLSSAVSGMSYSSSKDSAYTANYEVWCSIAADSVTGIAIESEAYSLFGVRPGMSKSDAVSALQAQGYTCEDSNDKLSVGIDQTGVAYITVKYSGSRVTEVTCSGAKAG